MCVVKTVSDGLNKDVITTRVERTILGGAAGHVRVVLAQLVLLLCFGWRAGG